MKIRFLLVLTLLCFINCGYSQLTIFGQLKDTANETVVAATVMLLNTKDSALINYTTSDKDGYFAFKNIKKTNYILKISHISYMPTQLAVNPNENEKEINFGVIRLKEIANFLMEVVIKEAKAPIFIRGDTVEYDATTFKVPPGSTVEDLLRKLPGIEIDANGAITTMGKNVKTVYVDGKSFFGNDPTTVTKNLDAQAIKKVQVYNEQTEQEKITGIKEGNKDKVMNLELKDEYKKGYFGKATTGYGWGENAPHRWLASGNLNFFTDKQQLSFMVSGNNINASTFNWSDYQEFKGQSMTTGWDSGDFGFKSNSWRGYYFSNYNGDGSGFSNYAGGGVNYNYFDKKVKFNVGYYYTLNKTESYKYSTIHRFLQETSYVNIDTAFNDNLRQNHSFSTRLEYDLDSNNNFVVRADVNYSLIGTENKYLELYQTSDLLTNINVNNRYNKDANGKLSINSLAIYSYKFKKKGRRFAISGAHSYSQDNKTQDIDNLNTFLNLTPNEQIKFAVKSNDNSVSHVPKSSILYVEPFGKMFTLQGFYNFSYSMHTNTNESYDDDNNPADSLWLNYKNNVLYNRVGTSLNFAYNGINMQAGVAYKNIDLSGESILKTSTTNTVKNNYGNFIPNFETHFDISKNFRMSLKYSYSFKEPEISYLIPKPNLSNNLYKTLGNENLVPERSHEVEYSMHLWKASSMTSLNWTVINAKFHDNKIVYNQMTEFVDSIGYVTTSSPENVRGGNDFLSYLWLNFPIVKTVLTMNISANGSIGNSPIFINKVKNITHTKSCEGRMGFNLNVGDKLSFNASGNVSLNWAKYSIATDRDQHYMNYSANGGFRWQFFKKSFLEGNYSFSNYNNLRLDFSQNIHTLSVSVRQVLGKKNQWELRLSANDLLNQNQYIRQMVSANYISYTQSPTLARYYMLTAAYNLRGFDIENKRR
jgi:hypothetical protein